MTALVALTYALEVAGVCGIGWAVVIAFRAREW